MSTRSLSRIEQNVSRRALNLTPSAPAALHSFFHCCFAKVAGPTAEKILSEALGLTKRGESPRYEGARGFGTTELAFENDLERPWRVSHGPHEDEVRAGASGDHPW